MPIIDAMLGAAVKSIDISKFEDEFDRAQIIEVEAVEVNTLEDRLDLLAQITNRAALSMPIRQKQRMLPKIVAMRTKLAWLSLSSTLSEARLLFVKNITSSFLILGFMSGLRTA